MQISFLFVHYQAVRGDTGDGKHSGWFQGVEMDKKLTSFLASFNYKFDPYVLASSFDVSPSVDRTAEIV